MVIVRPKVAVDTG
jgi:beta-xylosidase